MRHCARHVWMFKCFFLPTSKPCCSAWPAQRVCWLLGRASILAGELHHTNSYLLFHASQPASRRAFAACGAETPLVRSILRWVLRR